MKPLPDSYVKNTYLFQLVERDCDVCIYRQLDNGRTVGFEVFEVQKLRERIIQGRVLEAREATPSNEQWGQKGWTFWDLARAKDKAREIIAASQARKLAKRHKAA